MPVAADHFVILVTDIEQAQADYEALGFTVQSRADRQPGHGAHYRFVVLEDGSYLLLTQFVSPEVAATHRLGPDLAEGEGFADYSFVVGSVVDTGAALQAVGGKTRGPVAVQNVLKDGSEWGLELLMTGKGTGGDDALPFVVQDVKGRAFRIPAYRPHANGITRLAGLRVASADAEATARALGIVLQAPAEAEDGSFRIAAGDVVVEVPGDAAPTGRKRGGVFEILLNGRNTGLLDLTLSHGARLRVACR